MLQRSDHAAASTVILIYPPASIPGLRHPSGLEIDPVAYPNTERLCRLSLGGDAWDESELVLG